MKTRENAAGKGGRSSAGFTLLEILFALMISVIVLGGVFASLLSISGLFYAGSRQMGIHSRACYGMEYLSASIAGAESATVQTGGDRIDLDIPVTNLSSNISSTATTIPVVWTAYLPPSGLVHIEEEDILYNGKDETSLLSCTRGYGGTTAVSHSDGEIVYAYKTYYLDGDSVYLNVDGTPDVGSDRVELSNVHKVAGEDLFQLIPKADPYRLDRVRVTLLCFEDGDADSIKDIGEPGVDFNVELFLRNGH